MVRTADSHSANTGSIPVTAANKKDTLVVSFLLAEIIVAIREPVQAERLVDRVQRGASRG